MYLISLFYWIISLLKIVVLLIEQNIYISIKEFPSRIGLCRYFEPVILYYVKTIEFHLNRKQNTLILHCNLFNYCVVSISFSPNHYYEVITDSIYSR